MNARKVALFLVVLLAALAFTIPAASEQPDQIIVNNADELIETTVSVDPGLVGSLAGVAPRVVVEYSNHVRRLDLVAAPGALQTLLDEVAARVVVEYANTVRREDLAAAPGALQSLLDQVAPRIVFQYANTNRQFPLAYPLELIDDTIPPQLGDVAAQGSGVIAWTTDEFADSAVLYGTQPGTYPQTVSDPLYVKQHEMTLTVTPGTTYYYKVRSTDLSGNTSTSAEHHFTAVISVYLPLIVRDSS